MKNIVNHCLQPRRFQRDLGLGVVLRKKPTVTGILGPYQGKEVEDDRKKVEEALFGGYCEQRPLLQEGRKRRGGGCIMEETGSEDEVVADAHWCLLQLQP